MRSKFKKHGCDSVEQYKVLELMFFVWVANTFVLVLFWAAHSGSAASGDALGLPAPVSQHVKVFVFDLVGFRIIL
jgi:hypothetical protein